MWKKVVAALTKSLLGIRWEVVFVYDNSPDGTAAKARALAQPDPRVRIVHWHGRRGLQRRRTEWLRLPEPCRRKRDIGAAARSDDRM